MKTLLRGKRKKEGYFKYIMSVSHLWLGLLSSLVIIVVCLSGCVYAFKQQIENILNKSYTIEASPDKFASVDSLAKHFTSRFGKPSRILIPEGNNCIEISNGGRKDQITACYDSFSGKFLGLKENKTAPFFKFVLDLHRNLLLGEPGKIVVGSAVLIFINLLFSGFVLWLPSKMKQLKYGFKVKLKAKYFRLNYDLHKVLGFYALILLLIIALTGVYVSFHWVKNGIIVALGGESVVVSENNTVLKSKLADSFNYLLNAVSDTEPIQEESISYDHLLEIVKKKLPYPGSTIFTFSEDDLKLVSVLKYDRNNFINFYIPNRLEFNQNGKLIKERIFSNLPLNEKFKAIAKPLHTGEIMGLGSIIVYFLAALIGASLPVTGFIIWWKKAK